MQSIAEQIRFESGYTLSTKVIHDWLLILSVVQNN
jgi:hypothetical protein